ncbi:glycosyltransferase [bacterium]|nr:glycosyltransferase [bacterium]
MMTTFSVVLCTYNGARYLREQLDSIATQTVLPSELIACDDVSTDASVEMLTDFATHASFPVRIVRNPVNLRSTANFAQGMALATGDVIVLADQDDRWQPHKLERFQQEWQQFPETDLIFTDAELIDGKGQRLGRRLWDSIGFSCGFRQWVQCGRTFEVLLKRYIMTGATMAFRSELREQLLPIPTTWVHDAWIAILVAAMRGRIVMLPEPLIDYRLHASQQIGAQQRNYWEQYQFARTITAADLEQQALQFQQAAEHLEPHLGTDDVHVRALLAKTTHLRSRACMKTHRWRRYPQALLEFASGHYNRYSLGWKALLVDLLT